MSLPSCLHSRGGTQTPTTGRRDREGHTKHLWDERKVGWSCVRKAVIAEIVNVLNGRLIALTALPPGREGRKAYQGIESKEARKPWGQKLMSQFRFPRMLPAPFLSLVPTQHRGSRDLARSRLTVRPRISLEPRKLGGGSLLLVASSRVPHLPGHR